jgi:phosphoglycerate dehydrogenase-like enzyme
VPRRDAYISLVRSRTQLTQGVLVHASRLAAVGCFCIGTNQVDLAAARDLGIAVFNAPFSNTRRWRTTGSSSNKVSESTAAQYAHHFGK